MTPIIEKMSNTLSAIVDDLYPEQEFTGNYITVENTLPDTKGKVESEESTDIIVCNKNIMRVSSSQSTTNQYNSVIKGDYYIIKDRTYLLSFDTENTGITCYIQSNTYGSGFALPYNLTTNSSDRYFECDGERKYFKLTAVATKQVKSSSVDFISRSTETSAIKTGYITNLILEEGEKDATKCSDFIAHKEQICTGVEFEFKTYKDITHIYNADDVNMTATVRNKNV